MTQTPRSTRTRLAGGISLLASLAFVLGACSGATASSVPTLPAGAPTVPPSGLASACFDADTMAVIDQLKATGADVPTILAANKDKLSASLTAMQPADPAVVTWRDALVAAIRSDDAAAVATQISMLSSGQVTIPPC
jgi:hypothetical protein